MDANDNPTTFAELTKEGLLGKMRQQALQLGAIANETQNPNIWAEIVDRYAPWLAPAQFARVVDLIYRELHAARDLNANPEDFRPPISSIPTEPLGPEQTPDPARRFVYQVMVWLPESDPNAEQRASTFFIDSPTPLTNAEIREQALAAFRRNMDFAPFTPSKKRKYPPRELRVAIVQVHRSY